MTEAVIVALITGAISLIGSIISSRAALNRYMIEMKMEMKTSQAVTDTKITDLTREVRRHNGFAERMPVVEEQIKVANHRIEDLERKVDK